MPSRILHHRPPQPATRHKATSRKQVDNRPVPTAFDVPAGLWTLELELELELETARNQIASGGCDVDPTLPSQSTPRDKSQRWKKPPRLKIRNPKPSQPFEAQVPGAYESEPRIASSGARHELNHGSVDARRRPPARTGLESAPCVGRWICLFHVMRRTPYARGPGIHFSGGLGKAREVFGSVSRPSIHPSIPEVWVIDLKSF